MVESISLVQTFLIAAITAVTVIPAGFYLLLNIYPWLKYDWQYIRAVFRCLKLYKSLVWRNMMLLDVFEDHVRKTPHKTFLIFQDNKYSYEFMDRQMNKVANLARTRMGLKAGDTVSIIIHNEPAFIWTYLGNTSVCPSTANGSLDPFTAKGYYRRLLPKATIVTSGGE